MNAGSSGCVATIGQLSRARASSCQNPSTPASGPSMDRTNPNFGNPSRIAATLGRFCPSVTTAFAPLSRSRYASPSSPNSVKSGTTTTPSR